MFFLLILYIGNKASLAIKHEMIWSLEIRYCGVPLYVFVCLHVCAFVAVFLYVHERWSVLACLQAAVFVCMCSRVCMHARVCMHRRLSVCAWASVCMRVCLYLLACLHAAVFACMCLHVCMHAHLSICACVPASPQVCMHARYGWQRINFFWKCPYK